MMTKLLAWIDKVLSHFPKIHQVYQKYQSFILYFTASCLSLVLDLGLAYFLYIGLGMNLVLSNTLGLIAGFLFTYWVSKYIFHSDHDLEGLFVYLGTFAIGIVLSNLVLYLSNNYLILVLEKKWAFLLAKILSTVLPFFTNYFIRKYLFYVKDQWKKRRK